MRLRKDSAPADSVRAKAAKRLGRVQTVEILNWADMAGTGVAKALDDFRRVGDPLSLQEAQDGVSALAGAIDALLARSVD